MLVEELYFGFQCAMMIKASSQGSQLLGENRDKTGLSNCGMRFSAWRLAASTS